MISAGETTCHFWWNCLVEKELFLPSWCVPRLPLWLSSISRKTSQVGMEWAESGHLNSHAWPLDRYNSLRNSDPRTRQWSILSVCRYRLGLCRTVRYSRSQLVRNSMRLISIERAFVKAERLIRGGCVFSEFGSRRRRDYHTHDLVIQGLLAASQALDGPGRLQGTSNVHFAMKYDLTPIGTVAHEVRSTP